MRSKRAAIELSIGTIVVIVLAMTMLILGLVLVRTIFTGSTESVDTINEKVRDQIGQIFSDEESNVVVMLGSDSKAKVKVGTEDFGIAIGAKTYDGTPVGGRDRLQYKLSLDLTSPGNCVEKIGDKKAGELLGHQIDSWIDFDRFDSENAYARITVKIPKGTAICSQKVFIDVKDNDQPLSSGDLLGGSSFTIQVQKRLL